MERITDFHTHILPCIDDGSDSTETSLAMLRSEMLQNVDTVVLTPHFYPNNERPETFLERRKRSFETLCRSIDSEKETFPRLLVGAEVRYFEGISDCEYLSQLAISGTDSVMIEMPFAKWSERMLAELSEISQKQGLTPIIAHIDRYVGGFHSCVCLNDLFGIQVLMQASADFFIRRSTRKKALGMFKRGNIHLLGSDAHNMGIRKPNVGMALDVIKRSLGDEAIAYINSIENFVLGK